LKKGDGEKEKNENPASEKKARWGIIPASTNNGGMHLNPIVQIGLAVFYVVFVSSTLISFVICSAYWLARWRGKALNTTLEKIGGISMRIALLLFFFIFLCSLIFRALGIEI